MIALWIGCLPAFSSLSKVSAASPAGTWERLEPGLELGAFAPPPAASPGGPSIRVLRIDPRHFAFRLMNASRLAPGKPLSARAWARRHGLAAAINASMYQADHMTSVSLMKTRGHFNNTWFSRDKALLAFDPLAPHLPAVQILDRDCQDVPKLRGQYATLIQSIRMISCEGANVWSQQPHRKWSAAAIGQDRQHRILFIHSRARLTVHDLIDHLLALPLDLKRAMYVEGGPESQLYVRSGGREWEFVGNFNHSDSRETGNTIGWPVPNVVGIVPHRQ